MSPRPRRILGSNPRIAYSDIQISRRNLNFILWVFNANVISLAQWHQWLRYTRPLPPTISEQQADFVRRQELKLLAQAADERWAAKPSLLDKPREEIFSARIEETKQSKNESSEQETQNRDLRREKQWQPEAWMPASKR